jgi:hypothetical protein
MTLVRKPLSKSAKVLLILLVVVIIALPIVHFTGLWDQSFWGDIAIQAAMVGTENGWIAGGMAIGCGLVGFAICYLAKDYIIGIEGNNLQVTNNSNSYVAQEKISTPTQGTVVSA